MNFAQWNLMVCLFDKCLVEEAAIYPLNLIGVYSYVLLKISKEYDNHAVVLAILLKWRYHYFLKLSLETLEVFFFTKSQPSEYSSSKTNKQIFANGKYMTIKRLYQC